ncbi:hypothetical protein V8G54_003951 [Vigna mungo]|uniref:Uncharacterized protein n=1 Tax=Vigna mungo TaxID=3915 RepID=A0AAQ3PCX6_VIGMU
MDQTLLLELVHLPSTAPLTAPQHKQLLYSPSMPVGTRNNQAHPGEQCSGAPLGHKGWTLNRTRIRTHYQAPGGPAWGHLWVIPAKALPPPSVALSWTTSPSCPSTSYGRTTSEAADPTTPISQKVLPSSSPTDNYPQHKPSRGFQVEKGFSSGAWACSAPH